jgi:leader peptidase (prepilin peptidase)/N-methyltransferase
LAGVIGLLIGSFLNVVIARVPAGESIVRPRSRCPRCGTQIASRDNVPVISWLLLRGRCRSCGEPISWRYPAVEAACGALFAGAWLRFSPGDAIFVCALVSVLVALALIDLDHRRIPNRIVLPATAAASAWMIVAGPFAGGWPRPAMALACGAAGFTLLLLIALISGGMGFGDVKLAGLLGLGLGWFGWETAVLGAFAAFTIGGLVGALLLVAGRASRKQAIPFAPALCGGSLLALFLGQAPVRAWLHLG